MAPRKTKMGSSQTGNKATAAREELEGKILAAGSRVQSALGNSRNKQEVNQFVTKTLETYKELYKKLQTNKEAESALNLQDLKEQCIFDITLAKASSSSSEKIERLIGSLNLYKSHAEGLVQNAEKEAREELEVKRAKVAKDLEAARQTQQINQIAAPAPAPVTSNIAANKAADIPEPHTEDESALAEKIQAFAAEITMLYHGPQGEYIDASANIALKIQDKIKNLLQDNHIAFDESFQSYLRNKLSDQRLVTTVNEHLQSADTNEQALPTPLETALEKAFHETTSAKLTPVTNTQAQPPHQITETPAVASTYIEETAARAVPEPAQEALVPATSTTIAGPAIQESAMKQLAVLANKKTLSPDDVALITTVIEHLPTRPIQQPPLVFTPEMQQAFTQVVNKVLENAQKQEEKRLFQLLTDSGLFKSTARPAAIMDATPPLVVEPTVTVEDVTDTQQINPAEASAPPAATRHTLAADITSPASAPAEIMANANGAPVHEATAQVIPAPAQVQAASTPAKAITSTVAAVPQVREEMNVEDLRNKSKFAEAKKRILEYYITREAYHSSTNREEQISQVVPLTKDLSLSKEEYDALFLYQTKLLTRPQTTQNIKQTGQIIKAANEIITKTIKDEAAIFLYQSSTNKHYENAKLDESQKERLMQRIKFFIPYPNNYLRKELETYITNFDSISEVERKDLMARATIIHSYEAAGFYPSEKMIEKAQTQLLARECVPFRFVTEGGSLQMLHTAIDGLELYQDYLNGKVADSQCIANITNLKIANHDHYKNIVEQFSSDHTSSFTLDERVRARLAKFLYENPAIAPAKLLEIVKDKIIQQEQGKLTPEKVKLITMESFTPKAKAGTFKAFGLGQIRHRIARRAEKAGKSSMFSSSAGLDQLLEEAAKAVKEGQDYTRTYTSARDVDFILEDNTLKNIGFEDFQTRLKQQLIEQLEYCRTGVLKNTNMKLSDLKTAINTKIAEWVSYEYDEKKSFNENAENLKRYAINENLEFWKIADPNFAQLLSRRAQPELARIHADKMYSEADKELSDSRYCNQNPTKTLTALGQCEYLMRHISMIETRLLYEQQIENNPNLLALKSQIQDKKGLFRQDNSEQTNTAITDLENQYATFINNYTLLKSCAHGQTYPNSNKLLNDPTLKQILKNCINDPKFFDKLQKQIGNKEDYKKYLINLRKHVSVLERSMPNQNENATLNKFINNLEIQIIEKNSAKTIIRNLPETSMNAVRKLIKQLQKLTSTTSIRKPQTPTTNTQKDGPFEVL